MLFALILLFATPVLAEDLSWVNQAVEASKSHEQEAKSIVVSAQKSSQKYKRCKATQMMVDKAQRLVTSNFPKKDEKRYPDLLVFVSFSMPLATLKSLNEDVVANGGKLVFRGLVEGSFKKMAMKLRELSAEVLIDPTLFEDHAITQVPVFVKGKDKLTGNVSLEYVFSKFKENAS